MIKIWHNQKNSEFHRFNELLSKTHIWIFEMHDSINEHNQKNLKYHLNAETRRTFNDFKKRFSKKFILTNFNLKLLETVKANAFDRDINEIYNQKNSNNKLKVVAFYSKKLSSAKQHYEIHDKKWLIIVKCFENDECI